MALAAYRHLLRSAKVAFEGDTRLLTAARERIRGEFRGNAALSGAAVAPALQHAQEIAQFLRQNLVQGTSTGDGIFKLRIHDETERGDNDTIKLGDKTVKLDGKRCSDK